MKALISVLYVISIVIECTHAFYMKRQETSVETSDECQYINKFIGEKENYNCCELSKVVCENGHIIKFDFHEKTLSGSIPESIGKLTKLQYLSLSQHKLSGIIPKSIGDLTDLYYLALYNNTLSGPIPESIGKLTKLEYLYLYNNNLNGTIPISIENLTKLNSIELQNNNNLYGKIPSKKYQHCNYRKTHLCYTIEQNDIEFKPNYYCNKCIKNANVKDNYCYCNNGYYGIGYVECKKKETNEELDGEVLEIIEENDTKGVNDDKEVKKDTQDNKETSMSSETILFNFLIIFLISIVNLLHQLQ